MSYVDFQNACEFARLQRERDALYSEMGYQALECRYDCGSCEACFYTMIASNISERMRQLRPLIDFNGALWVIAVDFTARNG